MSPAGRLLTSLDHVEVPVVDCGSRRIGRGAALGIPVRWTSVNGVCFAPQGGRFVTTGVNGGNGVE
jgi:hypothetical protein